MAAKGLGIREALVVGFKYRRREAYVFFGCILLAILVCIVMRTQYTATAQLLVQIGRELVYRSDVGDTTSIQPTIDADAVIATNLSMIGSDAAEAEAINTIGIDNIYPDINGTPNDPFYAVWLREGMNSIEAALGIEESPLRQAVRKFDRKLTVDFVKKTNIITVSFMHPDPKMAARVANLVVAIFLRNVGQVYNDPNVAYMEKHVAEERDQLKLAEDKLTTFERANKVYQIDDQIGMLLRQRIDIDTGLKAAQARIDELQKMVAALQTQRSVTPKEIPLYSEDQRYKVVDDTESQLLTLQLQEKQLSAKFTDTYPALMDVRRQIQLTQDFLARTKRELSEHKRTGTNDVFTEVDMELLRRQAELTALVGRRDALLEQLRNIDQAVSDMSARQRQFQELTRDVSLRSDALKTSYAKLAENRMVSGLSRDKPSSFVVMEAASPPDPADPSRPLPLIYTIAAAVLGAILAAATGFLSYYFNDGFLTPEQASQRLQLPALAVVAMREDGTRAARRRRRTGTAIEATA